MTLVVPKDYEVEIQFPDGEIRRLNLFQMGMMAKAVRFRATHGVWPPSVNKLRLTKRQIADRFFIDPRYARTYTELAETLDETHTDLMNQLKEKLNGNVKPG